MILATQMKQNSERTQPPKHNVTTDSLGKMVPRNLTNPAKEPL
jgi:hypothetical protein